MDASQPRRLGPAAMLACMPIDEAAAQLLAREQLHDRGLTNRAIAAAVDAETLRKVHTGWFVSGEAWRCAVPERRHLFQVIAAHMQMRAGNPFVLYSAAALHGLPLFRIRPQRVHIAGANSDGMTRPTRSGRPLVARHEVRIPDIDLTEVGGIPCTTRDRTVFDLVRLASREAGVSIADAALRDLAWDADSWTYDTRVADAWNDQMRERTRRAKGARGIRHARLILPFADGRAQLPGESVSRLYLADLGFRIPGLQVPVRGPHGNVYYVDFDLETAWGEFDGVGKYASKGDGAPMSRLSAEKERQDWIHGTTHRPFARWGFTHMPTASALGARLAAFGVSPHTR